MKRRGGYSRRKASDSAGDADHDANRRTRHPPGLKGKAIGLWYRNLSQKNRAKNPEAYGPGKKHSIEPKRPKYFSLDPDKEKTIDSLLKTMDVLHEESDEGGDGGAEENPAIDNTSRDINSKYMHISDSQFKRKFLKIIEGSIQDNLAKSMLLQSKLVDDPLLNERLQSDFSAKKNSSNLYKKMQQVREKLPAFGLKTEIVDLIEKNQVVVISGETGCGKTTQVAQFILDNAIEQGRGTTTKIICTQPRRISAISIAERVATERAESLGQSVGYQIRLEKIPPRKNASILFCTTGILLQFMQSDPALREYSHIILDEIHERNTESDFVITLLKQVIPKRSDVKIILMSATLNAEKFSEYYDNCPCIHIPGFTYPVTEYYLEDVIAMTNYSFPPMLKSSKKSADFDDFIMPAVRQLEAEKAYSLPVLKQLENPNSEVLSLELIQRLLQTISCFKPPGAILVFLPGLMDISNLIKNLATSGQFPPYKFAIYPLHSRLPTAEQRRIFNRPPSGVRKIIIATMIAETSITIDDVIYVVDAGRTKFSRFDARENIEVLRPEWVTQANATQRRGRAGRVKPGECYRLFTRARYMTFDAYPTPEMLRTPLEQVILQAKVLQLGRVNVFLGSVMDPPTDEAIELSLKLLRTLNALDDDENLTPLGYHLANLPLDPRTGKMILWAAMFSCAQPIFAIAASLAFKDAFYCPLDRVEEANRAKLELALGEHSDHIALAEALRRYEDTLATRSYGSTRQLCWDYFLSESTLKLLREMKGQFASHLHEMKFLASSDPADPRANKNSRNLSVIKAIVCAGLYPNVATVSKQTQKFVSLSTAEDGKVKIHPSSINARALPLPTSYVTFFLKQKSSAIFLHDTTCVSEAALILSAPKNSIKPKGIRFEICLKENLSFLCKQSTAEIIQRLREEMDKLLEHKISHPGTISWDSHEGHVLKAIIEFISAASDVNDVGVSDDETGDN